MIACYFFCPTLFNLLFLTDNGATISPLSARKKRKSHMERIRFATMSIEKRAERNTKRRERYNSNKKGIYVSIVVIIMLQYTFVGTDTVLAFPVVPLYNY